MIWFLSNYGPDFRCGWTLTYWKWYSNSELSMWWWDNCTTLHTAWAQLFHCLYPWIKNASAVKGFISKKPNLVYLSRFLSELNHPELTRSWKSEIRIWIFKCIPIVPADHLYHSLVLLLYLAFCFEAPHSYLGRPMRNEPHVKTALSDRLGRQVVNLYSRRATRKCRLLPI